MLWEDKPQLPAHLRIGEDQSEIEMYSFVRVHLFRLPESSVYALIPFCHRIHEPRDTTSCRDAAVVGGIPRNSVDGGYRQKNRGEPVLWRSASLSGRSARAI